MTVKQRIGVAAVVLGAGLFVASSAEAGRIGARAVRQQKRIAQGVASGALTARETARLEARSGRAGDAPQRTDAGGARADRAPPGSDFPQHLPAEARRTDATALITLRRAVATPAVTAGVFSQRRETVRAMLRSLRPCRERRGSRPESLSRFPPRSSFRRSTAHPLRLRAARVRSLRRRAAPFSFPSTGSRASAWKNFSRIPGNFPPVRSAGSPREGFTPCGRCPRPRP